MCSYSNKTQNLLVKSSKEKNAYEKFYGTQNTIEKHLGTFGKIGIVTKHNNQHIKNKLEDHGTPCIFLGYAKDHAANVYRMLKLETNAVIIT